MHDPSEHNRGHDDKSKGQSFWRSRSGITLIVVLAVIGFLLIYEHRVHILGDGMLIPLLLLACVGVHFFMHGGHGGDGGHGSGGDKS